MRINGMLLGVVLPLLAIPAGAGASPAAEEARAGQYQIASASQRSAAQRRPVARAQPRPGSRSHLGPRAYRGPQGYRSHRGHGNGVRIRIGTDWRYGFWGPAWSYDPWFRGGYGYYGYYGYPRVYPQPGNRYGALDLDVSPERAEVWVDGQRVGVADEFDGFPSYLWLEEGTYDVAFYLPGRKTLARQYTIYGGLVIDVEDTLEIGDSVHPNDLATSSHVIRDERLRRERETREQVERRDRRFTRDEAEVPGSRVVVDARAEPGRLRVKIEPEDASIYLDGRFLGSGRELGALRAGLIVDAGRHLLEAVRPGYRAERIEIDVEAGEEESVRFELEEEALN